MTTKQLDDGYEIRFDTNDSVETSRIIADQESEKNWQNYSKGNQRDVNDLKYDIRLGKFGECEFGRLLASDKTDSIITGITYLKTNSDHGDCELATLGKIQIKTKISDRFNSISLSELNLENWPNNDKTLLVIMLVDKYLTRSKAFYMMPSEISVFKRNSKCRDDYYISVSDIHEWTTANDAFIKYGSRRFDESRLHPDDDLPRE